MTRVGFELMTLDFVCRLNLISRRSFCLYIIIYYCLTLLNNYLLIYALITYGL